MAEDPGAVATKSPEIPWNPGGTMPAERAGMRVQAFLTVSSLVVLSSIAALGGVGCAPATPQDLDSTAPEADGPEPAEVVNQGSDAVTGGTVAQAVANSCSTTSVKGLSEQIIAEGNCITAGAYAQIPSRSNLTLGSAVFPFLEKPARDQLVASLDAHKGTHMTINSALRTIAQQHLLYSWYQGGRCGIQLAAKPGNSNHETGLAFDTSDASTWRNSLEGHGFHYFGSADPVHFDYTGSGSSNHKGLDVKAFQRLWNANHPEDKIAEDGGWGPNTAARMNKAPADGFASGPSCGGSARIEMTDGADDPT